MNTINTNSEKYIKKISSELALHPGQIQATIDLLDKDATIPFIARYRKEVTGSLDEVQIIMIRDRLSQLRELTARRESILKSLEERQLLTEELRTKILDAETLSVLEDLYLPFRPKRRTRAVIAQEKGLEPLAAALFAQHPDLIPEQFATSFIDLQKSVESAEQALAGARDIIAEWITENSDIRASMREFFSQKGLFRSSVTKGKETEGIKYKDYYDWEEPVQTAPSHRILAMRRGEKEGFLSLRIVVPEDESIRRIDSLIIQNDSPAAHQVQIAIADSFKRLLSLSMETEIRVETKKRADEEAIRVFTENLKQLLLAPPLGQKRVLAIDPGFRTGCKMVCLDEQGKLLHTETIFPHGGEAQNFRAAETILSLLHRFHIEAIAIGNGTAGRETELFVRNLHLPKSIAVVMVNESGASIYSASEIAREEFPDHDVTVRGSVSIGRRLMDPLAELVKIDPKSIGVGQYQHDVDQKALKQSLDDVVVNCVNSIGVDVNTASAQLLSYVSGLGPQLARNILNYRNEHGPFTCRQTLMKVSRMGPKAFEQAAGFLRIRNGDNPLDASAVHPESYWIVMKMAQDLNLTVQDLMKNDTHRKKIVLTHYVSEQIGMPTLTDIMDELAKPGRDPRERFELFSFSEDIQKIDDLKPGMKLPGIVTNITNFGVFVDIGVHQDGLVHISRLADRFVKDPNEIVKVHQSVMVTVLEVDKERNRITLSMQSDRKQTTPSAPKQSSREKHDPSPPPKKGFTNNPFEKLLGKPGNR